MSRPDDVSQRLEREWAFDNTGDPWLAHNRIFGMEIDPEFPGQVYDPRYGRWCHNAEDLFRWLTRPNEDPTEANNMHGYPTDES